MGLHTWFYKNKFLYKEREQLYIKIDKHDNGDIHLDYLELNYLHNRCSDIDDLIETDYHDLFRTNKREVDGQYTNDVIYSKEQCDKWILENEVDFSHTIFDTPEQIEKLKEFSLIQLNKFWEEYPHGCIDFG
jgi:hypothetical protein